MDAQWRKVGLGDSGARGDPVGLGMDGRGWGGG